jgi:dihydrofolate reductase
MNVLLIVAMDEQRGIGKNNDLMWHLPNDMRFFQRQTTGHTVIMGRKNWDSIPERFRPLPNRRNIVLTRNNTFNDAGCEVFYNLTVCLNELSNQGESTVYIIGGGQIYKEALTLGCVDEMYITYVHHVFDADTFFPHFQSSDWVVHEVMKQEVDERHTYAFEVKHFTRK